MRGLILSTVSVPIWRPMLCLAVLTIFSAASLGRTSDAAASPASVRDNLLYRSTESAFNLQGSTENFAASIGIHQDQATVVLFRVLTQSEITTQTYQCQSDTSSTGRFSGALCQEASRGAPKNFTLGSPVLNRQSIFSSLESALSVFEAKIGKIEQISNLKFWQHGEFITIRITAGTPSTDSLFSCHLHGSDYDCHRTRRAGPNEPQE